MTRRTKQSRTQTRDVHQRITDTIVAAIEAGETTTGMPWVSAGGLPIKLSDGTPYQGVNVLHLWAVAALRGYRSAQWGGFSAWRQKGGCVRRGEKGTAVVYAGRTEREDPATGETSLRSFARSFTVFNRDQVDGLDAETAPDAVPEAVTTGDDWRSADRTDELARRLGARVRRGGGQAFYRPSIDEIRVPERAAFVGTATQTPGVGYASTLAHELVHWTAPKARADRDVLPGAQGYAREELVAELGAAFLAPSLGFAFCGVADHAGYIANWLELLKGDSRAIGRAAGDASRAARWFVDHEHGATVSESVADGATAPETAD